MTNSTRSHAMQQQSPAWSGELQALMEAYQQAGGDPASFQTPEVATLAVSGDQVLVSHSIPGVHLHSQPIENGVRVSVVVDEGTQVKHPVHLCFGVLPSEGVQQIEADYQIGNHAQVQFLAHCSFPNAIKVEHRMNARIHIGKNASMTYIEEHYHGQNGGIEVYPVSDVVIEEGGQLTSNFNITRGRVGKLVMDYHIEAGKDSLTELVTKAFGSQDDHIRVQESIRLNGENAHSLTKTRIAVKDKAVSEVTTFTEGNAPRARGHMDCTEIVRDEAIAHNNPIVKVTHAQAQVTHEAAIGTVNRRELETLMARGLDEDEAVDLIIRAMIRG
ncbi:SufB/SufD family protein [Bellilinea sp.]|jgi:Fe-S cluster assembly scaffold protein SufB